MHNTELHAEIRRGYETETLNFPYHFLTPLACFLFSWTRAVLCARRSSWRIIAYLHLVMATWLQLKNYEEKVRKGLWFSSAMSGSAGFSLESISCQSPNWEFWTKYICCLDDCYISKKHNHCTMESCPASLLSSASLKDKLIFSKQTAWHSWNTQWWKTISDEILSIYVLVCDRFRFRMQMNCYFLVVRTKTFK